MAGGGYGGQQRVCGGRGSGDGAVGDELSDTAGACAGAGTDDPRILIQGKPTEVQVNDGTVPETQASEHVTKLN